MPPVFGFHVYHECAFRRQHCDDSLFSTAGERRRGLHLHGPATEQRRSRTGFPVHDRLWRRSGVLTQLAFAFLDGDRGVRTLNGAPGGAALRRAVDELETG